MPPAPALHDVASKPLAQLMRELAELVKRARAGSLRSSEVRDPPITVIHLGEQSVQSVFGVIHPPKVALVGLGGIDVRPWVEGGQVRALPLLCATLALMATVVTLLPAIAPEVGPDTLAPARPLRQQVDLDSMDWLNFLGSLHENFGVTFPNQTMQSW